MNDFFKKQFENYEEQPQPELWDGVMNDVKRHNNVLRVRKIGFATLLVVGAVATAVFLLWDNNVPSDNNIELAQNAPAEFVVADDNMAVDVSETADRPTVANNTAIAIPTAIKNGSSANVIANELVNEVEKTTSTIEKESENTILATVSQEVLKNTETKIISQSSSTTENVVEKASSTVTQKTQSETVVNKMKSGTNPDSSQTPSTEENVKVIFPTAFTPDKSENNQFYAVCNHPELIETYELNIFSRGGLLLFHSKDINERWDGKYKGRVQPMGSYAYVMTITTVYDKSGERRVQKGTITIVR